MKRFFILSLSLLASNAFAVEQVQVLGLFVGKAMLQVDGQNHLIAVGEATPEGVKLVAADSDKAVVEFDGQRQELGLGNQISSRYKAAEKNVVQIPPDSAGMYRVDGAINSTSVTFLVDTGASSVAMSSSEARRLGIDYTKGKAGFAVTASSRVRAYSVILNTVTVGSIRLYGVKGVVLEGDMPGQILLGQTFLNRLHMQREGVLLRLEQNL